MRPHICCRPLRTHLYLRQGRRPRRITTMGARMAVSRLAGGLVRSLLEGEVATPGAWVPEQIIEPSRFFARLALSVETADPC